MFQDQDGEREILLGNKQLLGIFFVLAVLFAVFFTAGYMVGRNTGDKKASAASNAAETNSLSTADNSAGMGETHAVSPAGTASSGAESSQTPSEAAPSGAAAGTVPAPVSHRSEPVASKAETERQTSAKHKRSKDMEKQASQPEEPARSVPITPQPGQTYLQVAAVSRPEAETVAGVLSKRGFHAHVAPKRGTQWFRVLVGPVHDAGELSATRDALMKKGFREVFVQRY
jgi:cell division protein FtsN